MSKLIDAITNEVSGKTFPARPNMSMLKVEEEKRKNPFTYLVEHRIEIRFGTTTQYKPGEDRSAMERVVSAYKEAAFGDLRSLMRKLEEAVYEQDLDKAKQIMRELNREVF